MPIDYNANPFTLQDKINKLMKLTYQIHNAGDAEFARAFIIELIEKGYTKIDSNIEKQVDDFKKLQQ